MRSRHFIPFAALLAVGCADLPTEEPAADAGPPAGTIAAIRCTVSLSPQNLSCDQAAAGPRHTMAVYGGQHRNVRLTATGLSVAGSVFSFDVTVQNLLQQPLSTADGMTPHASGVRVFFASLQGTGGTGQVSVANATGVGTFTAAGQPYFQYGGSAGAELGADGMLASGETSAPKRWAIDLGQQTAATFTVYVAAEVPDVSRALLRFAAISAGDSHTCALTIAGKAYCWGYGFSGNLGYGGNADQVVPVAVQMPAGEVFTQISAGSLQTCAVAASGAAYCWGANSTGQLGIGGGLGGTGVVPLPVSRPDGVTFTRIATGVGHTCATGPAGAYCWGWGSGGVLGTGSGTEENSTVPVAVAVPAGETLGEISVGYSHACAIALSGTTYCWGLDQNGKLGNAGGDSNVPTPVVQPPGTTFSTIDVSYGASCALTTDGAAYCWGFGLYGQLGNGSPVDAGVPTPVVQPLGTVFSDIETGGGFGSTCAIGNTGMYCWGYGTLGLLGTGETGHVAVPTAVTVPAGLSFTQVSVGGHQQCAVGPAGTYCWGQGLSGELGNGKKAVELAPVMPVAGTRGL